MVGRPEPHTISHLTAMKPRFLWLKIKLGRMAWKTSAGSTVDIGYTLKCAKHMSYARASFVVIAFFCVFWGGKSDQLHGLSRLK